MQVDVRDAGLIPGWGKSPGGGHGNPLKYSSLENPMDRGAWLAIVCGVTKESDMTEHAQHLPLCRHMLLCVLSKCRALEFLDPTEHCK